MENVPENQARVVLISSWGRTLGAIVPLLTPIVTPGLAHLCLLPFGIYNDIEALKDLLESDPNICMMLEPIQGEAGVVVRRWVLTGRPQIVYRAQCADDSGRSPNRLVSDGKNAGM